MGKIRLDKLTREEREKLLKDENFALRVIQVNEKTVHSLEKNVNHIWEHIRDIESTAMYWITLTVPLSILQILPTFDERISKIYLLATFPTLITALIFAALTLQYHPNFVQKDFFTVEDKDIKGRLDASNANIHGLTQIYIALNKRYDRKSLMLKFISPSMFSNIFANILFIIIYVFSPQNANRTSSVLILLLSLVIWFYQSNKSITELMRYRFKNS